MKNEKSQKMAEELSIEELDKVTGGAALTPFRSITLPPIFYRPIITRPIDPNIFA